MIHCYVVVSIPCSGRYISVVTKEDTLAILQCYAFFVFSKFSPFLKMKRASDLKPWEQSYRKRRSRRKFWTYDRLNSQVLSSKQKTVEFLFDKGLLKREQDCPVCAKPMKLSKCSIRHSSEEVQFRCQRRHFNPSTKSKITEPELRYAQDWKGGGRRDAEF